MPMIDGLQRQQPLARYTAARLGGPADYLYVAKDPAYNDTIPLSRQAWEHEIPVTVIGGGANVLVSDAGIRGLTIINRATRIDQEDLGNAVLVTASSGTSLNRLARYCQEKGLSGMEWAIAIPGTVGGAVVNNAGAHGSDIARSLTRALVFESQHGERWYDVESLKYAYRSSLLKYCHDRRFFVMRAELRLQRDDAALVQERMDHNNDYRRHTQPPGASLGSIFKNPQGDYAGRLIEAAGLKGLRSGSVQVSPVHANFFVNLSANASAHDYFQLVRLVRDRVKTQFAVNLELEIQILGEW